MPEEDYYEYLFDVYNSPWIRSQPYFMAMTVGIALHITKDKRIKINLVGTFETQFIDPITILKGCVNEQKFLSRSQLFQCGC